jgi:FkbM family methyltransferase
MIDETKELQNYRNIIDVGGHIGYFAIHISQFCKDALVFSFEPEPQNYEILIRNIKINKLENKIIPSNSAISDTDGRIKLYLHDDTFAHSTSIATPNSIEVPCYSLEKVLSANHIENCDLLKLNAEGAEYPILLNAKKETLQIISSIRAHCHSLDSHRNVDILVAFLSANGFTCRKKGEFLYAVNNLAKLQSAKNP